jgi:hypothetical protein
MYQVGRCAVGGIHLSPKSEVENMGAEMAIRGRLSGALIGIGASLLFVSTSVAQPAPGAYHTVDLNQTNLFRTQTANGVCLGAFIETGSLNANTIQDQNARFNSGVNDGNWVITTASFGGVQGLYVRLMVTNPAAGPPPGAQISIQLDIRQPSAKTFGQPQAHSC